MVDILNLALPYFGLIFVGFACGKAKSLPESGLAWMNFFLLDVSLPALLFAIMPYGVRALRLDRSLAVTFATSASAPRAWQNA